MTARNDGRVEAAAKGLEDVYGGEPANRADLALVTKILAAADAHDAGQGIHRVRMDDAAVERAAKIIFPSYWNDFYNKNVSPGDIARAQDDCLAHIRAVIAALKEADL